MKKILFLLLWTAGILFPMAWLGRFSEGFRRAFDAVFSPLWMHILMHAGLFAVLAMLLAFRFESIKKDMHLNPLLLVLSAVLAVGLLQEGFQALNSGAFLPGAAVFDLSVDLAGGLFGWSFAMVLTVQWGKKFHKE